MLGRTQLRRCDVDCASAQKLWQTASKIGLEQAAKAEKPKSFVQTPYGRGEECSWMNRNAESVHARKNRTENARCDARMTPTMDEELVQRLDSFAKDSC